jgi:hypothetical protein
VQLQVASAQVHIVSVTHTHEPAVVTDLSQRSTCHPWRRRPEFVVPRGLPQQLLAVAGMDFHAKTMLQPSDFSEMTPIGRGK